MNFQNLNWLKFKVALESMKIYVIWMFNIQRNFYTTVIPLKNSSTCTNAQAHTLYSYVFIRPLSYGPLESNKLIINKSEHTHIYCTEV